MLSDDLEEVDPAAYLPTFTAPEPATADDGTPIPETNRKPETSNVPWNRKPEELAGTTTHTGISSGGKARVGDPKALAKTLAGLIGLGVIVVAGVMRKTGKRVDVRQPTDRQADGIAEPLARIITRHTDLSTVTPDLADVLAAGAALGDYLTDGPIVTRQSVESVPDQDDAPAETSPTAQPVNVPEIHYL